jgi:NAD(P)-dependent dehydrogenase (short-subunit alcohol dehydrogenase family)
MNKALRRALCYTLQSELSKEEIAMEEKTQPESSAWLGLAGRVCVVTGGGSGIGAETARQLAAVGASVAVLDRNEEGAASVAAEIENVGGRAISIAADVQCADMIAAAAARVQQELGACQVLVNNAAIRDGKALMDVDLEKWNQLIAVNLTGALICTQIFGRQMIGARQGGSIVNVASITGFYPMPYGSGYSVCKAGLMMLSRLLTVELADHRIRSNVVAPALVRTPSSEIAYQDPEIGPRRAQMVPSGRISTALDLANAIVFLASDRASYINGQEILIDGGLSQTLLSLIPRPGVETQYRT